MVSMLITWFVLTLAVLLTAELLPGFELKKGIGNAIIVAAIYGVLNTLFGWLLFVIIGISTLGIGFLLGFLTRWVVNALLLKLTDALTDRLTIKTFGWVLAGSGIISVAGALADTFAPGSGPR